MDFTSAPPRASLAMVGCFLAGLAGISPIRPAAALSCSETFWVAYDPQIDPVDVRENAEPPPVPEWFEIQRSAHAQHGMMMATEDATLALDRRAE